MKNKYIPLDAINKMLEYDGCPPMYKETCNGGVESCVECWHDYILNNKALTFDQIKELEK